MTKPWIIYMKHPIPNEKKNNEFPPMTVFFCFLSRNNAEGNGSRKSLLSDWVHPHWAHRTATTPAAPFPPLPGNLCGQGGREPGHDHTDWARFLPAHPMYSFLSSLSFIDLSQSVHCHYPQNAGELHDREEHHLLPWMHDSALLPPPFCCLWV